MGADRSIYGTMAMVVGLILAGAAWWCCGGAFVKEPAPRAPQKREATDMGGADVGSVAEELGMAG